MNSLKRKTVSMMIAAVAAGVFGVTGCSMMSGMGSAQAADSNQKVTLSGTNEVPPVRNTISTSFGSTPEAVRSESTQSSI